MTEVQIYFGDNREFTSDNFKNLSGIVGLYFIFLTERFIDYPFRKSKLIYIGMSEKRSNSISTRLNNHFSGESDNWGLINYRSVDKLKFTYINFDSVKSIWNGSIEKLETYFIQDFVRVHGVYPICNNKTGDTSDYRDKFVSLNIEWDYFLR